MSEPFLGEIRLMSFEQAPKGWALCNGQFMPINQNQALFSLLGTMFGGDGRTTFQLPDFRGRVPVHIGPSLNNIGQKGGQEFHTVTIAEMPTHTHILQASSAVGNSVNPRFGATGHVFAADPGNPYSNNISNLTSLNAATISAVGGSQPHENRQPYLTISFCIALQGLFPSPN